MKRYQAMTEAEQEAIRIAIRRNYMKQDTPMGVIASCGGYPIKLVKLVCDGLREEKKKRNKRYFNLQVFP